MLDCGGSAALPLRMREMYLEFYKCQPEFIHSLKDAYYYESDSLAERDIKISGLKVHILMLKKKKKKEKD